jgi:hypothetical protein
MWSIELVMKRTLIVTVLVSVGTSPVFAEPGFSPPGWDIAVAAQERHSGKLMKIRGVVGTAVSVETSGNPVVKVYTESPNVQGIPRQLDGHPVVIQVTGRIFAFHHCKGKHANDPGCPDTGGGGDGGSDDPTDPTAQFPRPVPIGVSTGHSNVTAGTIGARVTDGVDVYALSNNHVYADSNQGTQGDNVLQPGSFDGGVNPDDAMGTLFEWEPLVFDPDACTDGPADPECNTIDAAIALSSVNNLDHGTPSNGYGVPKSTIVEASANQKVQKYGRTTGLTKGQITGLNATFDICYNADCTLEARFVGQVVVEGKGRNSFSSGGDSGSLIVTDERTNKRSPVALVFAGGSFFGRDITIANPIDWVLSEFNVTIDGE